MNSDSFDFDQKKSLCIGPIPPHTSHQYLKDLFNGFGPITTKIVHGRSNIVLAYITFESEKKRDRALLEKKNTRIVGCPDTVINTDFDYYESLKIVRRNDSRMYDEYYYDMYEDNVHDHGVLIYPENAYDSYDDYDDCLDF